jgi:hypothetical protein
MVGDAGEQPNLVRLKLAGLAAHRTQHAHRLAAGQHRDKDRGADLLLAELRHGQARLVLPRINDERLLGLQGLPGQPFVFGDPHRRVGEHMKATLHPNHEIARLRFNHADGRRRHLQHAHDLLDGCCMTLSRSKLRLTRKLTAWSAAIWLCCFSS